VIVVDSHVIAYCWLNSPMTGLAQRLRVKDPDWHVPVLWRSEMRSVLAGYLRDGSLSAADTRRVMRQAEEALAGCEHLVSSDEPRERQRRLGIGDVLEQLNGAQPHRFLRARQLPDDLLEGDLGSEQSTWGKSDW